MKKKVMTCMAVLMSAAALSGCDSQLGGRLAKAGMNTVMGMGTVFIILIFIAFIISRFKYISRLEAWIRNRGEKEEAITVQNHAEAVVVEEEDKTDDLELVAVITAALAASLETSPDKLIVRSIRRKNTNRW